MESDTMNKKGFTLVELLAVLVILGIIMAIGVGAYSSYQKKAKDDAIKIAEDSMRSGTANNFINCTTNNGGKDKELCKRYTMPSNKNETTKVWLRDLIDESIVDPIANPYKKGEHCNQLTSYVLIRNRAESDKNLDLEYIACLDCGNYRSQNSRCTWAETAPNK